MGRVGGTHAWVRKSRPAELMIVDRKPMVRRLLFCCCEGLVDRWVREELKFEKRMDAKRRIMRTSSLTQHNGIERESLHSNSIHGSNRCITKQM